MNFEDIKNIILDQFGENALSIQNQKTKNAIDFEPENRIKMTYHPFDYLLN